MYYTHVILITPFKHACKINRMHVQEMLKFLLIIITFLFQMY